MDQERKFYLTKEGLEKLQKEYERLKTLKRAKAKSEAPSILESEDLNPEFVSYAEDLNFLESRLLELEEIFKNAELIKLPPKAKRKYVDLGAKVTVEVNGKEDEFEIVGTLEADPSQGKISNESPVGKGLLGHKVGDEVVVSSPVKTIYKIKKIRHG